MRRDDHARQISHNVLRRAIDAVGAIAMRLRKGCGPSFAILLMLPATVAMAEPAREITWDDLLPPEPELVDPLENLSDEAKNDLIFILRTEENIASGLTVAGGEAEATADRMRGELEADGLDVGKLVDELRAIMAGWQSYDQEVVLELDQQMVRIPGFALPLEVSDAGVSEFLLVPYVGACIHTPPPPANQMVLVELDTPYRLDDIYEAVWLTGELRAESSTQSLSYVDGVTSVAAGYKLQARLIEPYQW